MLMFKLYDDFEFIKFDSQTHTTSPIWHDYLNYIALNTQIANQISLQEIKSYLSFIKIYGVRK